MRESWAFSRSLLEDARDVLPARDGDGTNDFIELLDANELGLAFDVLVEVAIAHGAPRPFWQRMTAAAESMDLTSADTTHGRSVGLVLERLSRPDTYPCPCCGHLVFGEPPGSDEICPVCFWQDDLVQLRWPSFAGGANRPSLIEAQRTYQRIGACDSRFVTKVRVGDPSELDPRWRPFEPDGDVIETFAEGREYGSTYADDRTVYYYWSSR